MIMNTPTQHFGFNQKLLVIALLAALGPAHAEDDEVAKLINPDSTVVSVGLGSVGGNSANRSIFGQYNGWRTNGEGLLLDLEFVRRDSATGEWTNFEGRNLGLDNRELRFSQQKQGDWKYSAEYTEMVRHDPRTINSSLQGAGTTTPTVVSAATAGAGSELNLDLKRKGVTLAAQKWITGNLSVEASFKNEEKDGSRLFGTGTYCSNAIAGPTCAGGIAGALLMLPEPVNSTTRQFEAKLNYFDDDFSISGGYYGSFYNNSNASLRAGITSLITPDGTAAGTALNILANPGLALVANLQQPLALPPDNQAHQLNLSGNYRFDKKTRANFSIAFTHATQNDGFVSSVAGLPGNLGGVIDRAFAQLSVTSRVTNDVTLLADGRYERVDDKTPLAFYNTGTYANTALANGSTNAISSMTRANGKLEATIQLPENFKGTLGGDWAFIKRDRPVSSTWIPAGSMTAMRETTGEGTLRAELRRSLSDELNGGVMISHSEREGYHWTGLAADYPFVRYDAVYAPGSTLPVTMLDRERDKLKLMLDWSPMSNLSLQFMAEDGKDQYAASHAAGVQDTGMRSYGVDAAWKVSDNWNLTAYANRSEQTQHVNQAIGYIAALKDISTSVGFGVKGRIDATLDVGGDLTYLNDSNRYTQGMSTGAAIVDPLPDVTYRVTSLRLFANYALDKNSGIRVELVTQRANFNEWTWANNGVPFAYSDNTTVSMKADQNVSFIGARYTYKF